MSHSENKPNRTPNSVHFTSRDVARSVAYYRDTLGFQLNECWPDDKSPMWASLSLDGQVVMLGGAVSEEMAAGCDPEQAGLMREAAEDFKKHKPGVGVVTYLRVGEVDAYFEQLRGRGVHPLTKPTSQFYGIRDFCVDDLDGYRLTFYTEIKLSSCQSCDMPLKDAKPGQMYCGHCTDASGKLKPYEQVFEGTVQGYFMGMMKMPRAEAETAAREHLAKMPAWASRK